MSTAPLEEPVASSQTPEMLPPTTIVRSEPTRILDAEMADRLRNNSGTTLQWLGWEKRGEATVTVDESGVWTLSAGRDVGSGLFTGYSVRGEIVEIGPDYFLLDGLIRIENTPGTGRSCALDKTWRFGITQNRKYWRLREFEWCDSLTDYIDIYF